MQTGKSSSSIRNGLRLLRTVSSKLECYYIYKREDGVRIRPDCGPWLILGFDEIRKALREDRLPSFEFLKNRLNLSILDCLKFPKPKLGCQSAG
jgi:hypothetical protein